MFYLQLKSKTPIKLQKLVKLIKTEQTQQVKKTCKENTTLKFLNNLYSKGTLHVSDQGLMAVTQIHQNGQQKKAIIVTMSLLVYSIHLKTMQSLMFKFFLFNGSSENGIGCG